MAQVAINQNSSEMTTGHVALDSPSTTWVERLFMNLLSYLIVLIPIGFTVIATRYKLFPQSIQSSTLVQWFVYGSKDTRVGIATNLDSDAKSLLTSSDHIGPSKQNRPQNRSTRDSAFEFIWCLLGLQVSYLIWGLLQERIMTTKYPISNRSNESLGHYEHNNHSASSRIEHHHQILEVTFHDSQFLVFVNRLVAFITAIFAMVITRQRNSKIFVSRLDNGGKLMYRPSSSTKPQAPLYKYIYCSLSNIMSSWSQYEALKYVNFPTQCLSKSCKVIPVMLMSRILLRQRHPPGDYLCALLLALGMFIFMLGQPLDNKHQEPSSGRGSTQALNSVPDGLKRNSGLLSGLVILSLYLTFDSFTSNWQQSLYTQYDISNWQMMAAINFYSILLTLTSLHQLGGLRPALKLLASSSTLTRDCLAMSVMSSIGQMFVYYTIKRFGSVLFAVIMTLRQFLSILISIMVFSHQINLWSVSGLVLVFSVASYQVYHKSKRNSKKGLIKNQSSTALVDRNSSETILIALKK